MSGVAPCDLIYTVIAVLITNFVEMCTHLSKNDMLAS